MWSRRSFSAAFPPLPSRFRTFLHIYFLFFWWEQFTICYDIEIASVYANIGTERASSEREEEKFPSRRSPSSSSSSTSFSPHFIIFIHIRNEHSAHHFHPLHGSPIINLKLLAKAKIWNRVGNALGLVQCALAYYFFLIFCMNLSDQRLFSYRHASSHLESSACSNHWLLHLTRSISVSLLCLLCQFRLWWYCCYLFAKLSSQKRYVHERLNNGIFISCCSL